MNLNNIMTQEEIKQQASESAGGLTNDGTSYERLEHIEGFTAGANWAISKLQPEWISVKDTPQPKEGCYWVVVDGELRTAQVNSKELIDCYKDDMDKSGFWNYSDYADDEKLYPTYYLPFEDGLPKLPTT